MVASYWPHPWHRAPSLRGAHVVFGLALLFFARKRVNIARLHNLDVRYKLVFVHLVALALYVAIALYVATSAATGSAWKFRTASALWLIVAPLVVGTLLLALAPVRRIARFVRGLGAAWLYAALSATGVVTIRRIGDAAWDSSSSRLAKLFQEACFNQTRALLEIFSRRIIANAGQHDIGTSRFSVNIAGACSGIEGLALIVILTAAWLIFARSELKIERAILLIPVAVGLMWLLNIARLACLIAIGDSGHPDVAMTGFHAQAGWVGFNMVSFGFLITVQRIGWFRKGEPISLLENSPADTLGSSNNAVIYLAPFAAIIGAGLISQGAAADFEWLYPLRLVAVVAACWLLRREYRRIDWRFGILGPLAGLAVAGMWLYARSSSNHLGAGVDGTGAELAQLARPARFAWITLRVLAAVITVPIAEELAFRGFLARRLVAGDIDSVPYTRLSFFAVTISSIVFGAMHGRMWISGVIAGIVFALVAKLRGRLGEAVAAHVTANIAIAVVVLLRCNYSLW
jgi:exosortase E/protease (VPEID-CTERM system)